MTCQMHARVLKAVHICTRVRIQYAQQTTPAHQCVCVCVCVYEHEPTPTFTAPHSLFSHHPLHSPFSLVGKVVVADLLLSP